MRHSIQSFIQTLLFSNIFIGLVAVGMILETETLIDRSIDKLIYLFVFFSTLSVYAGYGILKLITGPMAIESERVAWNEKNRLVLWIQFVIGAMLAAGIVIKHPIELRWLLVPVGGTLLYTLMLSKHQIRNGAIFFLKSWILSGVWLYTTFILPQTWGTGHRIISWAAGLASWLTIYMICLLFDYRDRADRHEEPDQRQLYKLLFSFIGAVMLLLILSERINEQIYLLSKLCVLIFLGLTMKYSVKSRSTLWYYGVLDGVMGLPISYLFSLFI